jgi:hypothetical protein
MVIFVDVLHCLGIGNLGSPLLIHDSIGIWEVMCMLDVDSDFVTEQSRNFLQGLADRLGVYEVHHSDEYRVAYDENEEELPCDMLDCDRRDLHQHDCDRIECAEGHSVAGGSDGCWHDFGRVGVS